MKILMLCVGPTDTGYIQDGLAVFTGRLAHYAPFAITCIPEHKSWKKLTPEARARAEAQAIQQHLEPGDKLVLLDENGTQYSSEAFAERLEKWMAAGPKRIVFAVGGPYGFDPGLKLVAHEMLSLSKMTFSHQMVRLFFAEQLYRAFTILRNEPYHNR